jgi:hypothetical protein
MRAQLGTFRLHFKTLAERLAPLPSFAVDRVRTIIAAHLEAALRAGRRSGRLANGRA